MCRSMPELPAAATDGEGPLYQVIETREASVTGSEETGWLPVDSFSDQLFADGQDFVAITDMLRQLTEFQSGSTVGPFGRPGWVEELFSWVQSAIEQYGLHLSGEFLQLNGRRTLPLPPLETNGQAV